MLAKPEAVNQNQNKPNPDAVVGNNGLQKDNEKKEDIVKGAEAQRLKDPPAAEDKDKKVNEKGIVQEKDGVKMDLKAGEAEPHDTEVKVKQVNQDEPVKVLGEDKAGYELNKEADDKKPLVMGEELKNGHLNENVVLPAEGQEEKDENEESEEDSEVQEPPHFDKAYADTKLIAYEPARFPGDNDYSARYGVPFVLCRVWTRVACLIIKVSRSPRRRHHHGSGPDPGRSLLDGQQHRVPGRATGLPGHHREALPHGHHRGDPRAIPPIRSRIPQRCLRHALQGPGAPRILHERHAIPRDPRDMEEGHGVLRVALGQDRPQGHPADRGAMGVGLPGRHHHPALLW